MPTRKRGYRPQPNKSPPAALPNQQTVNNTDVSITEYLGSAGVTATTGFPLKPRASQTFDPRNTSAVLFAVAASGAPVVATIGFR